MNKEDNFINTLFEKTEVTEETEAVKPQTTEIIKMPIAVLFPILRIRTGAVKRI